MDVRPLFLLPGLLAALAVAGCGSSSHSASGTAASTARSAPAATTSAAVNPNAPEVNPPGDIPDSQVYVPFRASDGSYTIKVPEGWSRSSSGSAIVFTANLNSVRIEAAPAARAPTIAGARTMDVPVLSRANQGFQLQGIAFVNRPAGPALRIDYLADSAADPVTSKVTRDAVERYVFFHAGRQVTITLSGPQKADNVDPWKLITSSLRWGR